MAWVPFYTNLPLHPKFRRLVRALDVPAVQVVGHLTLFWSWTLEYAPGGNLEKFYNGDIEDAAQWAGDSGRFVEAMIEAGFIDVRDDAMHVHDWCEYAGKYERRRAANKERMESARANPVRCTCNAQPCVCSTRVKPEKRRGEKRREEDPPLPPKGQSDHPGFDDFKAAFPRECPRINWSEARKAWNKHRPDLAVVLAALEWQKAEYADWQHADATGKHVFIEAPAVWINQHNWERERPVKRAEPPPTASGRTVLRDLVDLAIAKKVLDGYQPGNFNNGRDLERQASALL